MFNGCWRLVWLFLVPQSPYAALSKSGLSLFVLPFCPHALCRALSCTWQGSGVTDTLVSDLLRVAQVSFSHELPSSPVSQAKPPSVGCGVSPGWGFGPRSSWSRWLTTSSAIRMLNLQWLVSTLSYRSSSYHMTIMHLLWQLSVSHVPIFSFCNCRKLMSLLASCFLFVFFLSRSYGLLMDVLCTCWLIKYDRKWKYIQ